MDNNDSEKTRLTPDLIELGDLCGCTEKQISFAAALLEGHNYTEAAFRAGYSGERDSVQLRSAGSSAARSKPVQALLALAESRGLGIPNAPGDMDELKRILWTHARSKDKQASIKATAELQRIEREERERAKDENLDPIVSLNEIADIMPVVAVALASQSNLDFKLNDEQQKNYDDFRRKVALEYLAEQREKQNGATNASTV
jgi:hypothetical protein